MTPLNDKMFNTDIRARCSIQIYVQDVQYRYTRKMFNTDIRGIVVLDTLQLIKRTHRSSFTFTFIKLCSHGYMLIPSLGQNPDVACKDDWMNHVVHNRISI